MKRYFALGVLLLFAGITGAPAQSLDEQYVQVFNIIQEADTLSASQPARALAKYAEAQSALQRMQKGSPDWNPKIINFRLAYVAGKISALSSAAPPEKPAAPPVAAETNAAPVVALTNAPAPAAPPQPEAAPPGAELETQIQSLREQVRQLQADRILMEAKLKEALSVQAAPAPSPELARAQEKLQAVQKENELLKASLEQEKSKPASTADPKALEQAQLALSEANRQLAQQKEMVAKLSAERDALEAKVKSSTGTPSAELAALQAENQLLKQRLAAVGTASQAGTTADPGKLAQAQAEIAALQSDKELLRLEKQALETRLKMVNTNTVVSSVLPQPGATSDALRVRDLELERDELQKKLDAANRALYGRKGKAVAARLDQLQVDLATARARLEIFEARQIPYTAEELALFKAPDATLTEASAKSEQRSIKELPAGSKQLVADAQRWFSSRQYDKAESAYTQVVHMDPKNVPALANLAAIEIEAGHLPEAEQNVRKALLEAPDDAFSLYILGILKFRQGNYDDSLNALSRAAKLDPNNAEIQNYLGLALSEKGMRGPAENALRKAVQLQPNYGGAHYNLAVIYLSQQPPATALARWHYQKALSTGHPRNTEVEQKLGIK